MNIPIFPCVGGKGRLRKWIRQFCPDTVRGVYCEPFAGRGNMLFYSLATIQAERYVANDKHQVRFWSDVGRCEVGEGVLDCFCTFGAKGGKRGRQTISDETMRSRVSTAFRLLNEKNAELSYRDGFDVLKDLRRGDFAYIDPPYQNATCPYPNIDHGKLLAVLDNAEFEYVLSGYRSPEYVEALGEPTATRSIQMSLTGGSDRRIECVWRNFNETNGIA